MRISDVSLTLFFTSGVGIETWSSVGNLDRELAIYRELVTRCRNVNFITYGRNEGRYSHNLLPIRHIYTNWSTFEYLTLSKIFLNGRRRLLNTDVVKTNQVRGGTVALKFKKIIQKPLIARCGYLPSMNIRDSGNNPQEFSAMLHYEKNLFSHAESIVVTTPILQDTIVDSYHIAPEKIRIIPNFVDMDVFKPHPQENPAWDLVYIGRSSPEKNLFHLIDALSHARDEGINYSLLLIGGAGSDEDLINYAKKSGDNITILPNMPNNDLPRYLNNSRAFILPSLYEGHPKTLLEAMSCGLPCIGTPVRGIQEEIVHEKTGYLSADTSSNALADAILSVLEDEALMKTMGKNARHYICSRYSLDKIADLECQCITDVVNEW